MRLNKEKSRNNVPVNITPQGRGKQGDFTLNLGHFIVKFFTHGGKTDVKYPFPGGTYIVFDLR